MRNTPLPGTIFPYYEAGHMMCNRQEDFDELARDVREFWDGNVEMICRQAILSIDQFSLDLGLEDR